MKPIIYINDNPYPACNSGLGFTIKNNIETMTNANHEIIAQRIGNDTQILNSCVWQILDAATWAAILQEFSKDTFVKLKYPDMRTNQWQIRYMVPQEQSAEVLEVSAEGLPLTYRNCTAVLLDTGR